MRVSVDISPELLAPELTRDQAFEFIKGIDDEIAEYDFTLKLAKHFIDVIRGELIHDPNTTLEKELGL